LAIKTLKRLYDAAEVGDKAREDEEDDDARCENKDQCNLLDA